jgi:hypothetical protein
MSSRWATPTMWWRPSRPCCVWRSATGHAGAAASHKQGAVADVGYDASGYTAPLGPDRDVDQDTAAGQGMAT